jgi:integrase
MATGSISKRAVDAIALPEPGKRSYLWDATLKGFGCMVTDKGVRSYLIQYRIGGRGSPTRRVTIGRHGSPWTPTTARDRASELLEQVRRKVDPFDAERQALQAAKTEAKARLDADAALAKLAFNVAADDYIAKAKKSLRRATEQEQVIDRDLRPAFGGTPLPLLTSDDINDQLVKVGERSPSAALKAYVALRAICAHAHDRHRKLFPKSASPLAEVDRPKAGGQREHHLSDRDIRLLWEAARVLGWPFGPIYQLLLLTGLRLREAAEGNWSEIDLTDRRWNLPGDRVKNGKAHWVHLSPPAVSIIEGLPRVCTEKSDLMFTTNGDTPVSGFSRAKSRLDVAMTKIAKADADDAETQPEKINTFVIHDLRRTFARGCQRLGYPPEVIERLLGHITDTESGLKGVYQTYGFEAERVEATERWAQRVSGIVAGGGARVVHLRGAA